MTTPVCAVEIASGVHPTPCGNGLDGSNLPNDLKIHNVSSSHSSGSSRTLGIRRGGKPEPSTARRRLYAVACPGRAGGCPIGPPTGPYVRLSLIRFLGAARFHTAKWSDDSDTPRHPSPPALQHDFSRYFHVPRGLPATRPSLSRSWAEAAHTPPSSDHTLATSSSGLLGGSASSATHALPHSTPGPGIGCDTGHHSIGSTHAASHTVARPAPGGDGGGCPGTNARTHPGCGGAACPPSSV
jgi:hypothetical protein